jgi:hypothetical protein
VIDLPASDRRSTTEPQDPVQVKCRDFGSVTLEVGKVEMVRPRFLAIVNKNVSNNSVVLNRRALGLKLFIKLKKHPEFNKKVENITYIPLIKLK